MSSSGLLAVLHKKKVLIIPLELMDILFFSWQIAETITLVTSEYLSHQFVI